MKSYLTRSPAEYLLRARQLLLAHGERVLPGLLAPRHTMPRFCRTRLGAAVRTSGTASIFSDSRPFFGLRSDPEELRVALRHHAAAECDETLRRAELVARGVVSLMGLGPIVVGTPPRWHREPVSGHEPRRVHWSQIPYLDRDVVGDHKFLWELNRMQHLVTVAQAYFITGDSRWPRLIRDHLRSWMNENPPSIGVNWASSLEVAYRAIAWCWTLRLCQDATDLHGDSVPILAALDAHGRHIERYLSTYFSPNTHLTGEALGLFYLGTLCPELRSASRWRRKGAAILEAECTRQIRPDGVYFEHASQYHRYTTEIFLHFVLLAQATNWPIAPHVESALSKLLFVLMQLQRGDGTIALQGDDDGGLLVPLNAESPEYVAGLLAAGAEAMRSPELLTVPPNSWGYALWLTGAEGVQRLRAHPRVAPSTPGVSLPDGGVFVIREGWGVADGHATIDAGAHGALAFGHSHADALSMELYAAGRPLLIDAGTYSYVRDERNVFRSTARHNTIELDGEGSCVPGQQPFRWESVHHARGSLQFEQDGIALFQGSHDGYTRLQQPAIHSRSVFHPARGTWIIEDCVRTAGTHSLVSRWHLAPGVQATLMQRTSHVAVVTLSHGDDQVATLLCFGPHGSFEIEPVDISRRYGSREQSVVGGWRCQVVGNEQLLTVVLDHTVAAATGLLVVVDAANTVLIGSAPNVGSSAQLHWRGWSAISSPGRSRHPGAPTLVYHDSPTDHGSRRMISLERSGDRDIMRVTENARLVARDTPTRQAT